MKNLFVFLCVVVIATLSSCKDKKEPVETEVKEKVQLKEVDQTTELEGYINDKYHVVMSLECKGKIVSGTYYYLNNNGKRNSTTLNLNGILDEDGHLEIHEVNYQGRPTGHFDGIYGKGHGYKGTFVNYRGEQMPFMIHVKEVKDAAGDGEGRGFLYDYEGEPVISGGDYSGDDISESSGSSASGAVGDAMRRGQQMAEDAMQRGQQMAEDAMRRGQQMAEDAMEKGQKMAEDAMKGASSGSVRRQLRQAQSEAREQMRQAQGEAREQMRQAQEDARRAMGL